jgi:hypothetical protein
MKKAEIEIGGIYRVRWHDGSFTNIRIGGTKRYPVRSRGYRGGVIGTKTRYWGTNLKTGRIVEIKSAAKLRERVG